MRGDAGRAIRFLEKSRASGSPSFIELMELGRALSLGERMEEARSVLKEAERLAPTDREVLVLLAAVNVELGRALTGMRRSESALSEFRRTVQIEPRFHEAFFEGARLLARDGDTEGAFHLLSRACGWLPTRSDTTESSRS